jgi:release factor glutamine methyltransferase
MGWSRADVITRSGEAIAPAAAALFRSAIAQRAARRPLQHLTGVQAFWRHEFIVSPDVLVPRPETEMLVELALDLLRETPRPVVVDVGTGSGCIALSLAAERPDGSIHATELSPAALAVARGNADRLGLGGRVTFHAGDLLAPVSGLARRVDLVVSNPPYVTAEEWAALEPEVRDHDPRMALVPEEGVATLYGRLLRESAALLAPGGAVAVEVGAGWADAVGRAAREAGGIAVASHTDLQGIPRIVSARFLA